MSDWHLLEDIELQRLVDDVKYDMELVLKQIDLCDALRHPSTEWDTDRLKRDIENFMLRH